MQAVALVYHLRAVPADAVLRTDLFTSSAAYTLVCQDLVTRLPCLHITIGEALAKDRFLRKIK